MSRSGFAVPEPPPRPRLRRRADRSTWFGDPPRRPLAAGHVVLITLAALILGALLNARGLHTDTCRSRRRDGSATWRWTSPADGDGLRLGAARSSPRVAPGRRRPLRRRRHRHGDRDPHPRHPAGPEQGQRADQARLRAAAQAGVQPAAQAARVDGRRLAGDPSPACRSTSWCRARRRSRRWASTGRWQPASSGPTSTTGSPASARRWPSSSSHPDAVFSPSEATTTTRT